MSVSAAGRASVKPPLLAPRRVQRIDVVIVAALILAAAGSAIGVMTYRDDRGGEFTVTWTTIVEEISADPIQIQGNSQGELNLDASLRNMTTAMVRVTIGGTLVRTAPAALLVEIMVPGLNETMSAEGTLPAGPPTRVTIEVPVDLGAFPTATSIRAASPEGAIAALDAQYGSATGTGGWVARVSVAPGAPPPLDATEPYDLSAVAEITTYRAEVSVDSPEVPR